MISTCIDSIRVEAKILGRHRLVYRQQVSVVARYSNLVGHFVWRFNDATGAFSQKLMLGGMLTSRYFRGELVVRS